MSYRLSEEQKNSYERDGYLILPGFFSADEIGKLYHVAVEDANMSSHSYDVNDESGKKSKLTLWFNSGDDIYGLVTRSERIVRAVDDLLEGDGAICHFHSKLMQKEPLVGGAWEWHQDYGYWYKNEFLFPEQMMSVMMAVTEANKKNGCLQVIKGSHKMGRVEHGKAGEQVGAAPRYIELALKALPLVYVELKAGDVLFFHSNILHRSDANLSETSRWSMISVYNRQFNIPYKEQSRSCITPLQMVSDDSIMEHRSDGLGTGADFLNKQRDEALRG
jgi:ectoine hydroxylase-related dioxygenase (phytanoyl-CoA dioxygenase family)